MSVTVKRNGITLWRGFEIGDTYAEGGQYHFDPKGGGTRISRYGLADLREAIRRSYLDDERAALKIHAAKQKII